MRIKKLLKSLGQGKLVSCGNDFLVKGIFCDSKQVTKDSVFVAIKGACCDAHDFIPEALRLGAKCIILQDEDRCKDRNIHVVKVKDSRQALAVISNAFYGRPSEEIKVIGITGTNGKTTVSYIIEAILKKALNNPGVIGTINYRFNNKYFSPVNTTPGPLELAQILSSMQNGKVDYLVMEVSSHALDQNRVGGIKFSSAVFTNITQDHLDYHHDMDSYFQAKLKLFKSLRGRNFAVVNIDDAYGRKMMPFIKTDVITYGIENKADVRAEDIKCSYSGTSFCIKFGKREVSLKTSLIGRHNVYNVLAAFSWGLKEAIALKNIVSAIENFKTVRGRLERVANRKGINVFVDYAHTDDALRNVIGALRGISGNKVIVVFGCGGDRDSLKRPKMGKVVTQLADHAIITNDNPRQEDPHKIIQDIVSGISKNNYEIITDREKAVKKAISLADKGEVVLIAGKGHEHYQILKNKRIDFDDRKVALKCLR
ncbi:MAG: UDP-N-acetylmuramoyl-L-alanyl-D-glutamate--2,6-diaminopimelate ligase [Candidatus Omnitrophica bacterium]|jgi:UDP-N-acetylmuramoyl-L-alanyl-D-glutamate--2,6-diaminopimelate ligase|nr:UDP-N-acetylmuramoyl-L-alanyl-D-glutamate--2,6-diaminopimelate ligase [Candidatus Omnitrophota bacterium]